MPCYWNTECYASSSILVLPSFMVFPFCRPHSFYLVSLYSLPPPSTGILSVFLANTISCGLHLGSGFTLTALNTAHLSTVYRDLTDDEPDLFHDFLSLPLKSQWKLQYQETLPLHMPEKLAHGGLCQGLLTARTVFMHLYTISVEGFKCLHV